MAAPGSREETDSLKPGPHVVPQAHPEPAGLYMQDLELVRRVQLGEPAAVEAFVQRLRCARRFLVYRNAGFGAPLGHHELEDTVQSTLLAVWRKLGEYAGRGPLEAWVYRFSYLELMNRLQALDRRPQELERVAEPYAEGRELDPLERERLYRSLERLERVEPGAADVIRWKHLEACTFEEVAAHLAISVNTAKTRYYRGMQRLRQLLLDPRGVGPDVRPNVREEQP
jgi:RNA polymerase sigma-70 factor (ECF subfamily)